MLQGRRRECRLLDELLAAVRAGESRTLILVGEAGVGKTALLEYAMSAATEVQSGGNGPSGQDETSEQTSATWDAAAFTALTPGTVPPALQP